MRSLLRKSVLIASAVVLLGGVAARADAGDAVKVKVPFPFVVHGQTLPAGEYRIERLDLDPSVLFIESTTNMNKAAFVATMPASVEPRHTRQLRTGLTAILERSDEMASRGLLMTGPVTKRFSPEPRGRRPGRTKARVVIERQPWHSISHPLTSAS